LTRTENTAQGSTSTFSYAAPPTPSDTAFSSPGLYTPSDFSVIFGPAGCDPGSGLGYPHLVLQAYPSVFGGRPLSALWTPSRQPAPQRASAAHPCAPSPGGDPSSGYEGYLAGSGGVVVTPRPWRGPRHSGKHSCWQLKCGLILTWLWPTTACRDGFSNPSNHVGPILAGFPSPKRFPAASGYTPDDFIITGRRAFSGSACTRPGLSLFRPALDGLALRNCHQLPNRSVSETLRP